MRPKTSEVNLLDLIELKIKSIAAIQKLCRWMYGGGKVLSEQLSRSSAARQL